MMKYLCLIYNAREGTPDAMPARGGDVVPGEVLAYAEELRRKGHFVAAHALQSGQTATTVRVRNGRLSTIEGPAAETREQLRAVVVIDARDLNEAIRLASKMPEARQGSIEIRPVKDPDSAAAPPPDCAGPRGRADGGRPGPG